MEELLELLEQYIIIKDNNRELYYSIKDNEEKYKDFLYEKLGYSLIIKEDFVKLEKVPAVPEAWMGIEGFEDIKEYIFFVLILMFLEDKNKEEQFILSFITEYIEQNYPKEKIEWTSMKNRRSLIKVMKLCIELGIINKNDGEEDEFSRNQNAEVLYESTGISRYIVRNFSRDIIDCENAEDLLKNTWENIDEDKGIIRRHRVYRRLLLSPIVYSDGVDDNDYDYIKKYRSSIEDTFEKYLQWKVHIHKNGALIILGEEQKGKDVFPNLKGESSAVLMINSKIRELYSNGHLELLNDDTILLSKENFKKLILKVREEKMAGLKKELRECSEEYFYNVMKNYMKGYLIIREEGENIRIMPLAGKIIGDYPKDYNY
jgi:uncharacterized protein (TIGR02678 family)